MTIYYYPWRIKTLTHISPPVLYISTVATLRPATARVENQRFRQCSRMRTLSSNTPRRVSCRWLTVSIIVGDPSFFSFCHAAFSYSFNVYLSCLVYSQLVPIRTDPSSLLLAKRLRTWTASMLFLVTLFKAWTLCAKWKVSRRVKATNPWWMW